MFTRFQTWLAKLVGPNAAHMIDGLIAVALVGGSTAVGALIYSAPARLFLLHHATLGAVVVAVVGIGVPAVTALASKFRKAAGSAAPLVDELTKGILDALGKGSLIPLGPPATVEAVPSAVKVTADVTHLIQTPETAKQAVGVVADLVAAGVTTTETPPAS